MSGCTDFTEYMYLTGSYDSFAGYTTMWVLGKNGIQNGIRNLICNFIRMTFCHGFRCEKKFICHIFLLWSYWQLYVYMQCFLIRKTPSKSIEGVKSHSLICQQKLMELAPCPKRMVAAASLGQSLSCS